MNSENGYYITRGEFLESFEEAAFSLDIGETSGIVKSANGYHIIKRYEQDPEYINDYFEELRNVYKARKFNELRDKTAAELKLKTTETYAGINKEFLMASFDSFSG